MALQDYKEEQERKVHTKTVEFKRIQMIANNRRVSGEGEHWSRVCDYHSVMAIILDYDSLMVNKHLTLA